MKIQDYDLSKQEMNMQDTIDDVKKILNLGNYEMKVIATVSPGWTETKKGIPVLSIYGGTRTLFISDPSATNGWVYVTLSEL